jgi:hypothetical protein
VALPLRHEDLSSPHCRSRKLSLHSQKANPSTAGVRKSGSLQFLGLGSLVTSKIAFVLFSSSSISSDEFLRSGTKIIVVHTVQGLPYRIKYTLLFVPIGFFLMQKIA